MSENKLLNLARIGKSKAKAKPDGLINKIKPSVKKNAVVEVFKTPEEERDFKAKKTIAELLDGVKLTTLDKSDDVIELDANFEDNKISNESNRNIEWLEEQVTLLTEVNDSLRNQLAFVKNDSINTNDNNVTAKVIELFEELQSNHIKLGTDSNSGIGNFRIYCPGFLNRMILFFPFLEDIKRY